MQAVRTGISEKMYLRTMEIDHPIERIDWLIDEFYDGKPKRWTDAMGLAASVYTNLKNGSLPSWKVLVSIKKAHPDISLEWLIMNNGPKTINSELELLEKNTRLRKAVAEMTRLLEDS